MDIGQQWTDMGKKDAPLREKIRDSEKRKETDGDNLRMIQKQSPINKIRPTDRMKALRPVYGSNKMYVTGLENTGNTCYLNSVLQCLLQTKQLVEWLMLVDRKN